MTLDEWQTRKAVADTAIALAEAVRELEEVAEGEGWTGCWFCAGAECDICQTLLPAFRVAESALAEASR